MSPDGLGPTTQKGKKSFITANLSKPVDLTSIYQGGYFVYSDHFKSKSTLKETWQMQMSNPSGFYGLLWGAYRAGPTESFEDRCALVSAIMLKYA